MEREVTLMEMLEARETRVYQQDALRGKYGVPVISFTLNIAGPVKDSPLIRRAFRWGLEQLEAALRAAKLPVLERLEHRAHTGCEGLYAVDGTAREIKSVCVSIEDGSLLGRLFDMDVLDGDGRKLDRDEVGKSPELYRLRRAGKGLRLSPGPRWKSCKQLPVASWRNISPLLTGKRLPRWSLVPCWMRCAPLQNPVW